MAGIRALIRLEEARRQSALLGPDDVGLTLPVLPSAASVAVFVDGIWQRSVEVDGQATFILPRSPGDLRLRTMDVIYAPIRRTRC